MFDTLKCNIVIPFQIGRTQDAYGYVTLLRDTSNKIILSIKSLLLLSS